MTAEVAARGEETMRVSDSGETKRTRRMASVRKLGERGRRRCGSKAQSYPEWQDEVGGKLVSSRHAALTILTKLARHFRASQLCEVWRAGRRTREVRWLGRGEAGRKHVDFSETGRI
jgi:hypothetical protein